MRNHSRRHRRSVFTRLGITVVLAGAVAVGAALPAGAHYELMKETPAAGSKAKQWPNTLKLVYSGKLIDTPKATKVKVTDASGKSFAKGAPKVSNDTVTQKLNPGGGGKVKVQWTVVYDDGHRVSDSYSFTAPKAPVEEAAPAEESATPAAGGADGAEDAGAQAGSDSADTKPAAAKDNSGGGDSGVWVPILLVATVLAVVVAVAINRKRRSSAS